MSTLLNPLPGIVFGPLGGAVFAPLSQPGEAGALPDVTVDWLHSPADVIAQLIVDLGHGSDPTADEDWPSNPTSEPKAPDNCITVYNTAGMTLGSEMRGGGQFERHGVQVRVRGKDNPTAYVKARRLIKVLAEEVRLAQVVLDGSTYLVWQVGPTVPVMDLNKDPGSPGRRNVYTVNALATIRVLSNP